MIQFISYIPLNHVTNVNFRKLTMKKSIYFYLSVCGLTLGISAWAIAAPPNIPSDLSQARDGIFVNHSHDNGVKRGHQKDKPTPPGLRKQERGVPNRERELESVDDSEKSRLSRFLDRYRNRS